MPQAVGSGPSSHPLGPLGVCHLNEKQKPPPLLRCTERVFFFKIWESFGGYSAFSRAQLSPTGLALETILQRRKPDQHRIGSGTDSPATERRSGVR